MTNPTLPTPATRLADLGPWPILGLGLLLRLAVLALLTDLVAKG